MPPVALHRCFRNIEWAVIVRRRGILAIGDPMIKKPTGSRSCGIRFIVGIDNVVLAAVVQPCLEIFQKTIPVSACRQDIALALDFYRVTAGI